MEATVQTVLKEFYTNTIVPLAEAEQLDPVELFNATIKSAVYLKEQDVIDDRRSSFFILKS